MQSQTQRLHALTSLRFFAPLIVVLFHFAPFFTYPPGIKQLIGMGPTGVAFFFVLSGFILTYTYAAKFSGSVSIGQIKSFLQARFARVYPMHLFTLLAITPLTLYSLTHASDLFSARQLAESGSAVGASWVKEALLVQVYSVGSTSIWNSPAWSIACETFFYLAFPVIIILLARLSPRVNLYAVMIGLAAVQIAVHIWTVQVHLASTAPSLDFAFTSALLRVWEFIIGCVLGVAYLRGRAGEQKYTLSTRGRHTTLLLAGAAIAGAGVFKFLGERGSAELWPRILNETMHAYLAYTLPFAAIIFAFASGRTLLSRLLEHKTLVLLGEASYSLYIIHWVVYKTLELLRDDGYPVPQWAAALVVVGLVGLSVMTLKTIEMPARNWLRPKQPFKTRLNVRPTSAE
ncbi:acyltransferase [Deinococcus sp. Arct2-2]|uniref:acyltransferase family protein n=1 Tax=Deinococcus sp. Arct2-2 TaxID=2568653 RepID=UPI0010A44AFE|nr:acyltransferase [Deinococcus sp. Arct2-2]THF68432.1 acyltransferase [Deinococcus sp. Arct2-2]